MYAHDMFTSLQYLPHIYHVTRGGRELFNNKLSVVCFGGPTDGWRTDAVLIWSTGRKAQVWLHFQLALHEQK